jgi:AraC-like DNA-binding protein/quercetin dioxygenase-like cupin family protein
MPTSNSLVLNHIDFRDLTQKIAIRVKDFADGAFIEKHTHDSHQLLYATSGVMRLYASEKVWIVPDRRAVFIPAEVSHSIKMHGKVEMRTLYIDPEKFESSQGVLKVISVNNLMRELIIALSKESAVYQLGSRCEKIAQLIEIEFELAQKEQLYIPLPVDSRLQIICASLLAKPSDTRSLDCWGDACGTSIRTLNRLFEKDLGMSFRQWRKLVRIHSSIEDLSQGLSIEQTAKRNGYRSPSAYSSVFKSIIGQPPSSFNKELK